MILSEHFASIQATDVKHLRDENRVLREEIEQMTREIDGLSNGRDGKEIFDCDIN